MELLDIVDEQGIATGVVMDREKVHDLNMLHWEIAVFVVNNKRQILLQQRSATKRFNPNKWGLCAGHVDSGEDIDDAALRELEEEIGLSLSKSDLNILENRKTIKKDVNSHLTRFYYVVCNKNKFRIQEEEVSEVKWVNIDDVINMIKNNDESLVIKNDRLYLLEKLKNIVIK